MNALDVLRLGAEAYFAELSNEEVKHLLTVTHPDMLTEVH